MNTTNISYSGDSTNTTRPEPTWRRPQSRRMDPAMVILAVPLVLMGLFLGALIAIQLAFAGLVGLFAAWG